MPTRGNTGAARFRGTARLTPAPGRAHPRSGHVGSGASSGVVFGRAPGASARQRFHDRRQVLYSYRYFSDSSSARSMSAIVSSGMRSWASVTSAEAGWASAGSHSSGFHALLRSSDLGQCG